MGVVVLLVNRSDARDEPVTAATTTSETTVASPSTGSSGETTTPSDEESAGEETGDPESESVRLFALARFGQWKEARELYDWFLPLLRLDTVPKFVQLIKLVQAEVGRGSSRVRPPRLELEGRELVEVRAPAPPPFAVTASPSVEHGGGPASKP